MQAALVPALGEVQLGASGRAAERRPHDVDPVAEAVDLQVPLEHRERPRVGLEADDAALGADRAGRLQRDVADVRAALEHGRSRGGRSGEQLDEVALPAGLDELPHVVQLSDVVALEPEPVDLDREAADGGRHAARDAVDEAAEPEPPQHACSPLEQREQRETRLESPP